MTVLSAFQSAAVRLIGTRPSSLFSSSDQFSVEMADLVNETAQAIAKASDWRRLTTLATLTGDGATESFSLPSDYDRMPTKGEIQRSGFSGYLRRAHDLDEYLAYQIDGLGGWPGNWIMVGGTIKIWPALASASTAQFYYQSSKWAADNGGTPKSAFTVDSDTFLLPERLLTLGLIWRWRAQKRLEYSEDMQNYEIALSEDRGREKGSRILAVGRPRMPAGFDLAWPGVVEP